MLYYLLSVVLILLLFTIISFGDNGNECNSIVYTNSAGLKYGYPINKCQFNGVNSNKYICNGTLKINYNVYDSNDCTGNPITITENICGGSSSNTNNYNDCTIICNKNDCNGISVTTYLLSDDCSSDITTKSNYLPSICNLNSIYTCSGSKIQKNTYINNDCSGNPLTSIKYNSGCNKLLTISTKYDGCNSCTTFNLFGACAVIILFITSLLF